MYTTEFFIKKFEAIPEEIWYVGAYQNLAGTKYCALGFCGDNGICSKETPEADALSRLFQDFLGVTVPSVNDGDMCTGEKQEKYQQPTPKQRILAALYDIKVTEAVKEFKAIVSQPQTDLA